MTSEQMQDLPDYACTRTHVQGGEPFRTFPDPDIHIIGGGH